MHCIDICADGHVILVFDNIVALLHLVGVADYRNIVLQTVADLALLDNGLQRLAL